ncbi:redoxin domain-containing protein [Campylobacter sp. CCUG 57310]|uniref:redoxin domain-containing protein n=1 Tax=Campylobacter sp. CCUG 57310 TaxID=2517362 RepID=UPI0015631772|nr:redoxin domain-containing protein [Campylobacter sp. CCUG 57310]QKF91509.1 peroxiredoxin domain-containing protein [Campylobacter sp. CCUG 57310]
MSVKDINGNEIDFLELIKDKNCVLIVYPKMGESGKFLPDELKQTKGLTGCTNQCKAYEANLKEIEKFGFEVIALGALNVAKTKEFKEALGVNFSFFSDENFKLADKLNLKTFSTDNGKKFYHRQTLIIKKGEILKRFDLVENPEEDALNTLKTLAKI